MTGIDARADSQSRVQPLCSSRSIGLSRDPLDHVVGDLDHAEAGELRQPRRSARALPVCSTRGRWVSHQATGSPLSLSGSAYGGTTTSWVKSWLAGPVGVPAGSARSATVSQARENPRKLPRRRWRRWPGSRCPGSRCSSRGTSPARRPGSRRTTNSLSRWVCPVSIRSAARGQVHPDQDVQETLGTSPRLTPWSSRSSWLPRLTKSTSVSAVRAEPGVVLLDVTAPGGKVGGRWRGMRRPGRVGAVAASRGGSRGTRFPRR